MQLLLVCSRYVLVLNLGYSTNALDLFLHSTHTHTHTNDDCVLTFFKLNFYSYATVFYWRLCRYTSNETQLVNFVSECSLAVPFALSRQLEQA